MPAPFGKSMVALPEEIMGLLNDQTAAKVLGTRSAKGDVHLINVGGAGTLNPETIYIGEIFMKKTGDNLKVAQKDNTMVSMLVTKGYKSYEIKAKVKDHQTSGPDFNKLAGVFKAMKFDLKGLWLLTPVEIWNQSPTYDAGKKML